MRITILQGAFFPVPPILGGAVEKIWYRMGKEFAALGHEVTHIGCSHADLPDNESAHGVNYIRIPGYDFPSSLIRIKLFDLFYSIRAIKKIPKNVDIIVTSTFWAPLLLWGKNARKVYVDVQRVPRGQMRLYNRVGILRGCSPSIYEAIKKEIPANFQPIVSYIPNPVPFDVKSTLTKREKIILFVGRLHPEKGIHILLKAFSLIKNDLSKDWKIIIVGPHDYKFGGGGKVYLQHLLTIANNTNVEFAGHILSENKLVEFYARATIFCYPSQEGSGDAAPVAPREAMAYGCVPVVSKLECFKDIIIDEQNGIIYNHNSPTQVNELSQTLSFLMKDNLRIKSLSEEAKLVSQRFAPREIAEEFIMDFERIQSAGKRY